MNVDADKVINRLMRRISELEYELAVKDAALEQLQEVTVNEVSEIAPDDVNGVPA